MTVANHDPMYLFAESEVASQKWYEKLELALQKRDQVKTEVGATDLPRMATGCT